jgi:GNAT superfamily N-acetyltransferase
MNVRFERVTDLEGAARWHALEERSVPLDHPGLLADPLEEVASLLNRDETDERAALFVATDDGRDLANALVWLPMRDNVENAGIFFSVDPDQRRQGVGGRFAEFLLEFARGEGRRRAVFYGPAPLDGEAPGAVLAERLGAELAFLGVRRQLDVDTIDVTRLDALEKERVGDHAKGYELVTWIDTCPEHLVDDAAALMARMGTDAPMGDLAHEPEVWDAARYRRKEEEAMERSRRRFATGAVECTSGRMVAYTDIGVSVIQPLVAYQWDTIVDPEHRGHRLGLLVKIANLKALRRFSPTTASIQTWNAESNEHMVAINDELGFRPAEYSKQWQLEF